MENASRALLMAGGILMGILILTTVVIMWNSISGNQASQTENDKDKQLAEFNSVFDTYANSTVRGTDIISLFNRVNSYSKNIENEILLSKIQYEDIEIIVNISNCSNNDKTDFSDSLGLNVSSNNYNNITKEGSATYKALNSLIKLEKTVGRDNLTKLVAAYNADEFKKVDSNGDKTSDDITDVTKLKDKQEAILGKKLNTEVKLKKINNNDDPGIKEYATYTKFKTYKFVCETVEYSEKNGQVKTMTFNAK